MLLSTEVEGRSKHPHQQRSTSLGRTHSRRGFAKTDHEEAQIVASLTALERMKDMTQVRSVCVRVCVRVLCVRMLPLTPHSERAADLTQVLDCLLSEP